MNVPVFAAEIKLFDDVDEGLRVECSETYVQRISEALRMAGFECDPHTIAIKGTANIHNWVEFKITRGSIEQAKNALISFFSANGVTTSEEGFIAPEGESELRIYLTNVSVFDK